MAEHRPTPYSISVAALIALHCQENSPLYEFSSGSNNHNDDEEFVRVDALIQSLLLDDPTQWHNRHAPPVAHLLGRIEEATGGGVVEDFKLWLQIATSSVDALMDLVATVKGALKDGIVDATSANGVYIRQCVDSFDDLSFESVIRLFRDFQGQVVDNRMESHAPVWTLSPAQMDIAIRQQCAVVASMPLTGSEDPENDPAHSLDVMQEKLHAVLLHNPELPAAHFLKFLLCLQTGERVGAMDALHAYLDYAMIHDAADTTLQFAAILKAALHDQFGEHELARVATEEAVKVAQQSQDPACVAFALGWLSVHQSPGGVEHVDLLSKCVARAHGTVRSLVTGANLSLAASTHSWSANSAAVADPSDVMGVHDRPTHVPVSTPSTTTAPQSSQGAKGGAGYALVAPSSLKVDAARQSLVGSAIWNHFGIRCLSEQASLSALQCNQLSRTDKALAIENVCNSALSGPSSSGCIYSTALQVLLDLRTSHRLQTEGTFLFPVALLFCEWTIRRGDYPQADTLTVAMESHLNPRIENYEELVVDVSSLKALLLSRQGRFDESKQLLGSLLQQQCEGRDDRRAKLLLQLSVAHLDCNKRQFTRAIPIILECVTLAEKKNMSAVHAAAMSLLAQVQMRMGNYSRATALLRASLPTILQQGHVWQQGEGYLTLAKCYVKCANGKAQKKRTKLLRSGVEHLKRSVEFFGRCQDCLRLREAHYFLARVYDELPGCEALRDAAAEHFARLQGSHPLASTTLLSSLTNRDKMLALVHQASPITVA